MWKKCHVLFEWPLARVELFTWTENKTQNSRTYTIIGSCLILYLNAHNFLAVNFVKCNYWKLQISSFFFLWLVYKSIFWNLFKVFCSTVFENFKQFFTLERWKHEEKVWLLFVLMSRVVLAQTGIYKNYWNLKKGKVISVSVYQVRFCKIVVNYF